MTLFFYFLSFFQSGIELNNPDCPSRQEIVRDAPPNRTGMRRHPPPRIPHSPGNHHVFLFLPFRILTSSSRFFRVFPPRKVPSPWRQRKGSQRGESRKVIKRSRVFHCWVWPWWGWGPAGGLLVCAVSLCPLKAPWSQPHPLMCVSPRKISLFPFCRREN